MPGVDLQENRAARRNLELKVRVPADEHAAIRERLARLGAGLPEVEHQEDRYFRVAEGRLKLRTISTSSGAMLAELIAYRRPDEHGSRWSAYAITPIDDAQVEPLARTLAQVLPVHVVIRKRREILLVGVTRVHLDEVEELGTFVELETVIHSQSTKEAAAEHQYVIDALELAKWPVEAGSYSDLLLRG